MTSARRTQLRVVAPFVGAGICLVVAGFTGPIAAWLLLIAAFGLILDGVTLLWSRGGGLNEFRQ